MKVKYFLYTLFCCIYLIANSGNLNATCKNCTSNPEQPINLKILRQIPVDKATIGVIPYYITQRKIYILLGRDSIGYINPHGKYSDFGGRVLLDGSTLVASALVYLKAKSMGYLKLTEDDLLSKSLLVYKTNNIGHQVIYLLYPLSQELYLETKKFNEIRDELAAHKRTPHSYLEKDRFYWFALEDMRQHKSVLQDIDQTTHTIKLQDFFEQDFVMHPKLPKIIADIKVN